MSRHHRSNASVPKPGRNHESMIADVGATSWEVRLQTTQSREKEVSVATSGTGGSLPTDRTYLNVECSEYLATRRLPEHENVVARIIHPESLRSHRSLLRVGDSLLDDFLEDLMQGLEVAHVKRFFEERELHELARLELTPQWQDMFHEVGS